MKVIFLDIDGVLNRFEAYVSPEEWEANHRNGNQMEPIEKDKVSLINTLSKRTGANIVISSAWRLMYPWKTLVKILRDKGLKGNIIGQTPYFPIAEKERGDEIKAWLVEHPEVTGYVVIDDRDDMSAVRDHFVQTNQETGITKREALQAFNILGRRR